MPFRVMLNLPRWKDRSMGGYLTDSQNYSAMRQSQHVSNVRNPDVNARGTRTTSISSSATRPRQQRGEREGP
jgi:hypothetical protein